MRTKTIEIDQETYDKLDTLRAFWGLESIEDTIAKIIAKGQQQMYVYNTRKTPTKGKRTFKKVV